MEHVFIVAVVKEGVEEATKMFFFWGGHLNLQHFKEEILFHCGIH